MSSIQKDDVKNQVIFTPTHIKVYEALERFWVQTGYAPLLREIADSTGISQRTVQRILVDLLAVGSVSQAQKRMRGYKPLTHPKKISLK